MSMQACQKEVNMTGFYRRALSKLRKFTEEQCRELVVSAAGEISRLENVLDSLPSGILVCDEKHFLVLANKSARRLLPFSRLPARQPESGLLWELITEEHIADFFRRTLQSGDKVLEQEINIKMQGIAQGAAQGANRLLSVSVLPLVEMRRITGSLVRIEDITEKRNKEIRLHRAENLASLTNLAAGVAHEIKNPLGAISIHLQLMRKSLVKGIGIDSLIDNYFNILNEEVDRLNRIVVDFLFAVRPMMLELREADINHLVADIAEFTRAELEQNGIRLFVEPEENLPPVLIDERRMKQVFFNLVKNAQDAMPSGGLLTIATLRSGSEVLINVCDTGIGMSDENLRKIFEPYYTTKENGTGLGLTLVYKIIKEHRGEISVDSREGEGSEFVISLPVSRKELRLIEYNK